MLRLFMVFTAAVITAVLIAGAPSAASADTSGSTSSADTAIRVQDYKVDIKVNKDESYDFTEHLTVNYLTARHGIYRYIPTSTDYAIRDISVEGGEKNVVTKDENRVIRIGSEDETVTGVKKYTIKYTIAYYQDHDSSKDVMNIDIFPASWRSAIDKLTVTLNYPADMKWKSITTYSGAYGAKDNRYGYWQNDTANHRIVFTAYGLPDHVGATVRADLPDGYWNNHRAADPFAIFQLLAIAGALAALIVLRLMSRGKDHKAVKTVEFYPPEGMSSVEVGYLIDGECSERDITSLAFALAAKRYIRIDRGAEENGHTWRKKSDIRFTKLADPPEKEKYLKKYMAALFGPDAEDVEPGTTVTLESLRSSIGKKYDAISQSVTKRFHGRKPLYEKKSEKAMNTATLACAAAQGFSLFASFSVSGLVEDSWIITTIGSFGFGFIIPFMGTLVVSAFKTRLSDKAGKFLLNIVLAAVLYLVLAGFSAAMAYMALGKIPGLALLAFDIVSPLLISGGTKMTERGAKVYGQALGFRQFVKDAEAEKLNALLEQDPDYYYEILPYAYVFGLVGKWSDKFRDLNVGDNDCLFGGPLVTGAAIYGMSGIESGFDSIAKGIKSEVAETSSSYGGDSGGGSGSGGGGGGGGSW
ncbi:MAG: DUF2207 domain-containing protein [Anaerovoracaceae bacterium]